MKKATKAMLNKIYKTFDNNPKSFSVFVTFVSVAGLVLLIIAAHKEKNRHIYQSSVEEGERNVDEFDNKFAGRMNREIKEINEVNTLGTIFVFLGFFLQQVYNIIFRM